MGLLLRYSLGNLVSRRLTVALTVPAMTFRPPEWMIQCRTSPRAISCWFMNFVARDLPEWLGTINHVGSMR